MIELYEPHQVYAKNLININEFFTNKIEKKLKKIMKRKIKIDKQINLSQSHFRS